jgi:hypothetical protein
MVAQEAALYLKIHSWLLNMRLSAVVGFIGATNGLACGRGQPASIEPVHELKMQELAVPWRSTGAEEWRPFIPVPEAGQQSRQHIGVKT